MARSNFLHSLETKIGYYKGELQQKREEVDRIRRLSAALPAFEERIDLLEALIESATLLIRNDHPEWECDTVDPVRPQVHKTPIRIGEASRKALDVLRDASEPLRTYDIAVEVLRREGITDPEYVTINRLTNSLGNILKKRAGKQVESDGQWPQKWQVIR